MPVMEDNPDSLFMEKFSFPELNYTGLCGYVCIMYFLEAKRLCRSLLYNITLLNPDLLSLF